MAKKVKNKIKMLDLFAGCGGLTDGFMQTGCYEDVAAVEWKKPQVLTLRNRLISKWNKKDADESVLHFDIQREEELFNGWSDDKDFGSSEGLDYYVNNAKGIDVIIGGPPCQAYSVAGRVRDENGMQDDYRNYLFEHYLSIVDRYKPDLFIFENVFNDEDFEKVKMCLKTSRNWTTFVNNMQNAFNSKFLDRRFE